MRRYSELKPGFELPRVKVEAVNTAAGSGIHDDAEAARYGYRGGLVPGPTVYSYVDRVLQRYLGTAWAATGQLSVNFARPFYDGEDAAAGAVVTERTDDEVVFEVWGENAEGVHCARGTARFPLTDGLEPPDISRLAYVISPEEVANNPSWPRGELPIGIPYTPKSITIGPDESLEYAQKVGDDSEIWGTLVHPGMYVGQSIRLRVDRPKTDEPPPPAPPSDGPPKRRSPGMHIGSEATYFRPSLVGETYSFYGTYLDTFEKKGNRYGTAEIIAVNEARECVFRTRNTFIFRLQEKQ